MTEPLRVAPRGRLAAFVRGTTVVANRARGEQYTRLPNGEVDLVARVVDGNVFVNVLGTRQSAVAKPIEDGLSSAIAVHFRAGGAYPFFGVPLAELTDGCTPIEELWGDEGVRLRDALSRATGSAEAVHALEEALLAHLRRSDVFEPAAAMMVRRAVRHICEVREPVRIADIARVLGVSARNLRRAFHDVVGVGPKTFVRTVRFQRALRAARDAATPDWGVIATNAGYYDQSHLIADFQELAGTTPGALVSASSTQRLTE